MLTKLHTQGHEFKGKAEKTINQRSRASEAVDAGRTSEQFTGGKKNKSECRTRDLSYSSGSVSCK